jgi:hypothetical protein
MLPFIGNIIFPKDRLNGASRLTGPTINALGRIDVKQIRFVKTYFVLARVNTINRTSVNASGIFSADTRFTNYKYSHEGRLSLCEN